MKLLSLTLNYHLRSFGRSVMTVLAIAAGTASIVMMLTVAQSSAGRIASSVLSLGANTVSGSVPAVWEASEDAISARASETPEIEAIGTFQDTEQAVALSRPIRGATVVLAPVIIASPTGLRAHGASAIAGTPVDWDRSWRTPPAISVGTALAKELGIDVVEGKNIVKVGELTYFVAAIVADDTDSASVSPAVIVSPDAARSLNVLPAHRAVLALVSPGAEAAIAKILPVVIDPYRWIEVAVSTAPTPQVLTGALNAETAQMTLVITLIVFVTSAFGALTTMQTAVWDRRSEIGIRRAMGESRGSVGLSFLLESALLGFAGSLAGFVIGVVGISAIELVVGWDTRMPLEALLGLLLGPVVGAVAGTQPALRAAGVEPLELLRT